jgi:TusA-related sulfurtransferase
MCESIDVEVDATGLQCPMPLLKAKRALHQMQAGQVLRLLSTDRGSVRDIGRFAEQAGHTLLAGGEKGGVYTFILRKRNPDR